MAIRRASGENKFRLLLSFCWGAHPLGGGRMAHDAKKKSLPIKESEQLARA